MPPTVGRAVAASCLFAVAAFLAAGARAQDAGEPLRNRLGGSASPYLLAHAEQPVHWQPWDKEALALAVRLDKPIFLSIGYSACHWCHVMAKESFADPKVAARLNELFVCIKVDREQRPDVDEVYMAALQAMGRQGGWPLSAWLTPDGKPFFAGTYFPPADAHGQPGFLRVVEQLGAAWRERKAEVRAGADELVAHLQKELAPAAAPGEPTSALRAAAIAAARERFDAQHGGFGAAPAFAPKFPSALELLFLLGCDDEAAVAMARQSLRAMARGGVHDQLAGGFHRYTVDRAWAVPHFEKMLYDNALLAEAGFVAWTRHGDAELRAVAAATLDWLRRDLQLPAGGFAASVDAQSEGEEGRCYVWSKAEFDAVLGDDAVAAAGWFGVNEAGDLDGRNVLALPDGAPAGDAAPRFAAAKAKLLAARAQRPQPLVDDKALASWNGMALRAFAVGYGVEGRPEWLASARACAEFLLRELVHDGRVRRAWRRGAAGIDGGLDDHAAVALGLLALFEVDPDPRWLAAAQAILAALPARFDAGAGMFWNVAQDDEQLVVRTRTAFDNATPSGTALAAAALLRAGLLLADESLWARGAAAVRAHHGLLTASPAAAPALLAAAEWLLAAPREVVVVGAPDDPATRELLAAARCGVGAPRVVANLHAGNREALAKLSPLFAGKEPVAGAAMAYVCARGVCKAPVATPAALAEALR